MFDQGDRQEIRRTGHNWLDLAIAVTAVFISITSLIVAIVHSRTLERMADANAQLVEANSWPFVSYSTSNVTGTGQAIDMALTNDGVGPAKIESVELKWKGKSYHDAQEFLEACCDYRPDTANNLQVSYTVGVLRAGDAEHFLTLPRTPEDSTAWLALNRARLSAELEINVCYCSVFDECWKANLVRVSLRPPVVPRCVEPSVSFRAPG